MPTALYCIGLNCTVPIYFLPLWLNLAHRNGKSNSWAQLMQTQNILWYDHRHALHTHTLCTNNEHRLVCLKIASLKCARIRCKRHKNKWTCFFISIFYHFYFSSFFLLFDFSHLFSVFHLNFMRPEILTFLSLSLSLSIDFCLFWKYIHIYSVWHSYGLGIIMEY